MASQRSQWLADLAASVARRQWNACPRLLFRVLYGAPATDLLPLTAETIRRYLPVFEGRWPGVGWPREILDAPEEWLRKSGRARPDAPEPECDSDGKFLFSLDALLLATNYQDDVGILTSSCACGIIEVVGALALGSVDAKDVPDQVAGCGSTRPGKLLHRDPDSPLEIARSREWQNFLDLLVPTEIVNYPDPQPQQLEVGLALWERHAMLLIVPEAASLFT
jgi:hypothetical protein